ncbi:MAG: hypothetical protein H7257_13745 [Taibaiella sp.]|nr:hypothetical protein [Taibaiella sp.]
MAATKYIISVPKPCNEDWNQMTPAEKGRHCSVCQVTVIDYTTLADREIVEAIQNAAGGHTCGRYHLGQLDRVMAAPQPVPRYHIFAKKIAATPLLSQALGNTVFAQVAKPKTHQQHKKPQLLDKKPGIRGHVADYLTKALLANVRVSIEHTTIFAITDLHGFFFLPVNDADNLSTVTVIAEPPKQDLATTPETYIKEEVVQLGSSGAGANIKLYRYPLDLAKETVISAEQPHLNEQKIPYETMTIMTGMSTTEEVITTPKKRWFHRFKRSRHYSN